LYAGNEYAAKSAIHEFRGLQLFMSLAIGKFIYLFFSGRKKCNLFCAHRCMSVEKKLQGIHFPLMCLITWRGYRLVAVSVLPIDKETLVYGSAVRWQLNDLFYYFV
jgi:hypothetical protein